MRRELPKNLGDYKFALDVAGDANKNIVLKNSNTNKAEYAMSKIFELSKENLYIFAGDFSREEPRSKAYIKNLISFLREDISNKINVILENDNVDSEGLNILKILKTKEEFKNKILLRVLNSGTEVKKTKKGNKFHFSINPKNGIYRFEYDTKERKALLNFNDSSYSDKLKGLFDDYLKSSSEIGSDFLIDGKLKDLENELNNDFLNKKVA